MDADHPANRVPFPRLFTFDGTKRPVTVSWTSIDTGQAMTATLVDQPIIATNAVIYVLDDIDV